jgi:hypothetical protein
MLHEFGGMSLHPAFSFTLVCVVPEQGESNARIIGRGYEGYVSEKTRTIRDIYVVDQYFSHTNDDVVGSEGRPYLQYCLTRSKIVMPSAFYTRLRVRIRFHPHNPGAFVVIVPKLHLPPGSRSKVSPSLVLPSPCAHFNSHRHLHSRST